MRRTLTRSLVACAVVLGSTVTAAGAAGAAQASTVRPSVSCYGDYCSGLDPQTSGCSADGKTVAYMYDGVSGVTLELRWSPTCQTNWARVNTTSPAWIKAVQKDTGYTQWGTIGMYSSPYTWSRQIYSPSKCVYAQASVSGRTLTTTCV